MAIFKTFANFVEAVQKSPYEATELSLDAIALSYADYAYIGARKSLKTQTLERAAHLPSKQGDTPQEWARQWYGMQTWETNSGVFPDFVLAYQDLGISNDGALLELKDSQGRAIASFNSTLPIARKALGGLNPRVRESAKRWDTPRSQRAGYADERDCFYLIRTARNSTTNVRISLIQGTFFETLSTQELLKAVWQELLRGKVSEQEMEQVAAILSRIDRTDISTTRRIAGASIKPRLRLMSEIEAEGNPHTYDEILPRTLNLILKPNIENLSGFRDMLADWAKRESLGLTWQNENECRVNNGAFAFEMKLMSLQHKRNGIHWVCQFQLPTLPTS